MCLACAGRTAVVDCVGHEQVDLADDGWPFPCHGKKIDSREGLTDCELYIVGEKGVHVHNWDREDPLRDILKRVEINYWPHHSSQGEEEYSE